MPTSLLTACDVAFILNVSKSTIYKLIRTGKLPAIHIGTAVRIRPEDLDAFIQSNTFGPADFISLG